VRAFQIRIVPSSLVVARVVEVVPRFVELEVAVPHLSPAKW
jgi:hypothetical protein